MTNSSQPSALRTLALAVVALSVLSGCGPKDGSREFAEGQAAYGVRSLEKAERLFAKSLRLKPGNVDACVMLARVQADLGKIAEAGETIAQAVALAPDAPDVALLDAEIAFYADDCDRALKRFAEVANDDSAGAEAQSLGWTGVGIVEMSLDHRDFSRIAFLRAIRLDRRNPSARYHLGLLYRGDSFGYLNAALEQFEIFVRLGEKADSRALHAQRVIIPGIKADIARLKTARFGGHRDANESAKRLARAEAAWKKGNFKAAFDEYAMAAKEDPLNYPAALGLAKAWEKKDSSPAGRRKTLDCYKTACALNPSAISAFLHAGALAVQFGQYATAVEFYSRAVAASPTDVAALRGLVGALRKAGGSPAVANAYQLYLDSVAARKPAK